MAEESFLKSLFHGLIAEGAIFPYPEPSQSEGDRIHVMMDGMRRFFAAQVDSKRIDRDAEISPHVLTGLKDLGLFGLLVPQDRGGSGLSTTGYARVIEEVASLDPSIALTLGAHQSLGMKGLLLFGNDEQKKRYLPRLATGELVAAFALTEHSAGSDSAAIQTRAEPAPGGGYILGGSKIWITNGGIADLFTVFARTSPAEEGHKPRITAFLVERGKGVRSGPNEPKLGVRGSSTTEVFFDEVHVPEANVLGEVGRGFKVAMEILTSGRLGLASGSVGACKRLIKLSVERVKERKAFNRPIGEFGLIKDKIATMMAETFALESMTYLTTGLVDAGVPDFSVESAICKIAGSETLWRTANEAMQIAAGVGYMAELPYERLLRDSRVNLVFEGTNEILRCFVALSGMQGPGRELAEVAKAIREPIKGFGLLSDFAIRKARTALGRERASRAHPALNRETVILEEYTADLARNVDKAMRKHGNQIHEMQYTQRRIADMAIDLYAVAACVARTTRAIERRGEEGARREIDLTSVFAATAQTRLREVVQSFDRNDDELRKAIATKTYTDGGYPFDIL